MSDYDRFDDGIEEWREDMAESDDWQEQRKANYVPPELRHEKALEFVERESHAGGGFWYLTRIARRFIANDEIMSISYAVQDLKYNLVRDGICTAKEAKDMFKYVQSSTATISRELLKAVPDLEGHIRLRECSVSEFYPEFKHLEHPLIVNQATGGDEAA